MLHTGETEAPEANDAGFPAGSCAVPTGRDRLSGQQTAGPPDLQLFPICSLTAQPCRAGPRFSSPLVREAESAAGVVRPPSPNHPRAL